MTTSMNAIMSTSPILALRAAILACCAADPTLVGLMGGAMRLHDEPPRAAEPVYAMFADGAARDWSTGSGDEQELGHEQDLAIAIWARPGNAASGLAVAERIATLLHEADLALAGHRLVNLRVEAVEHARDRETGLVVATLRLRAVTEIITGSA